jgi:hypothetical protein
MTADSYQRLLADPERCVTQAYLVEGCNRVRVYQPAANPPEGFVAVPPTLEDAYLVSIKTGRLGELPFIAAPTSPNGMDVLSAAAKRGGP